jgi:ParB family chromosome partitioning protein
MKIENFEVHPAAMLFPMMDKLALQALAWDIGQNGLREPIVLYEGKILDGRCRLKACKLAGVLPRFEQANGNIGSPVTFVMSQNQLRRHLTDSERPAIASKALSPLEVEEEANRAKLGEQVGQGYSVPRQPRRSRDKETPFVADTPTSSTWPNAARCA